MKLIKLARTTKEGFKNFFRNGWLTLATVFVLTLSLYVVGVTAVSTLTVDNILKDIQQKITISLYFKPEISENEIFNMKEELEQYQEIAGIDYISKESALEDLKKNSDSESTITKALNEIGENPLLASLVIRAMSPDQYELIASSINNSELADKVSRMNYEKNKEIIGRLGGIVALIRKVGLLLGGMLVLVAILVTFNTVRLTIYSQKQEFEIMRLVGASNMYVRIPYLVEGLLYGLASALVALGLLSLSMHFLNPLLADTLSQNLFSLYLNYIWYLATALVSGGMLLGLVSSFIAMRKYLKV